MGKPYMPLMMGDWIRGTQGMRAEVKGVYIGLLIHQYDHGFLPSAIDDLCLIEPEVGKVWDKLSVKFREISPGKLQNEKLEEVRAFWSKQSKNGQKGGRPKGDKPKLNPIRNPNTKLHNDTDLDTDLELKEKNSVSSSHLADLSLLEWHSWGQAIVSNTDQFWEGMGGRIIESDEMANFLSVASRNDWSMPTQQRFRTTLFGFDSKKGTSRQAATKEKFSIDDL